MARRNEEERPTREETARKKYKVLRTKLRKQMARGDVTKLATNSRDW
eukprot:CAMPEP_0196667852 /NCGR_PEP_ID=MMETSP1086-20130531/65307_1 /TAXON_ID=77921 /ORGANISM="Cyanoptyche  gloeocystis , Strain SAG4.97" /LENGTH=46 /DNA_ID= /DNA_START= /DNA_END= /DNA_ORIENTATION=